MFLPYANLRGLSGTEQHVFLFNFPLTRGCARLHPQREGQTDSESIVTSIWRSAAGEGRSEARAAAGKARGGRRARAAAHASTHSGDTSAQASARARARVLLQPPNKYFFRTSTKRYQL